MYKAPKLFEIRDRLLADFNSRKTSNTAISDDLARIIFNSIAAGLHPLYIDLENSYTNAILTQSSMNILEINAAAFGIVRDEGSFATGSVEFESLLDVGEQLPTQAVFLVSSTGSKFEIIEFVAKTDKKYRVKIKSVDKQDIKLPADTELQLELKVGESSSNLSTFATLPKVVDAIGGGANLETDANLRSRFLNFLTDNPKIGRLKDYETWAMQHKSVTRAQAIMTFDTAPCLRIYCVNDNDKDLELTATALSEVLDLIKSAAPVGIKDFEILNPEFVDITINLKISPMNSETRTKVINKLRADLPLISDFAKNVKLSDIYKILSNLDYLSDFEVINTGDFAILSGQIAKLESIEFL